jgi:hypothetical protein
MPQSNGHPGRTSFLQQQQQQQQQQGLIPHSQRLAAYVTKNFNVPQASAMARKILADQTMEETKKVSNGFFLCQL